MGGREREKERGRKRGKGRKGVKKEVKFILNSRIRKESV